MKIFKFATFVVAIALFYNCSNHSDTIDANVVTSDNKNVIAKIPSDIYSDATFVAYVKASYADSQLVKDNAKLTLYMADNNLSDIELLNINTVMGYSTYTDLINFTNTQAQRAAYLNRTYGINSLTVDEKLEIFETGLIMNTTEFSAKLSPRERCRLKVNAETIIMHVGCAAADVTVVLGILCHGAASVYQYASLDECNDLPN